MHRASLLALVLVVSAAAQDPFDCERIVGELDAAVGHYERLGFEVGERGSERVAFVPRGRSRLVLVAGEPSPGDEALVVLVGDLGRQRRALEKAEMRFAELVACPSGAKSLLVVDGDGHRTIFRTERDAAAVAIPAAGEFNPIVLEVIARYPTDGTHRYHWPKQGGWKGNTKDLEYGGEVFAAGDPEGRCYCCGLTFEVLIDAWRVWCARNGRAWRVGDLDVAGVRKLQRQWFGSAADRSCLHTALVENDLGFRVTDWKDARPGDFVQLWRENGSGHSVVFLGWEREHDRDDGRITGIRYWSTQGATDGIGARTESFEANAGRRRVLRDELWLCRVGRR